MKRLTRHLFEKLGLVRTDKEKESRYAEADEAIEAAWREVEDARRRRGLTIEVQSYRTREGQRR